MTHTQKMKGKHGGGPIQALAIMGIIIAMYSTGLITYVATVDREYDIGFDDADFNSSFTQQIGKIEQISGIDPSKNIERGSGEISSETRTTEGFLKASFDSAKLLLSMPGILKELITDSIRLANQGVGIPAEIQVGLIAIITIIVALGLVALITKLRP